MGNITTLQQTNFEFPGQQSIYHGKVRDVYKLENDKIILIASDRLSAFDVVSKQGIPYKGQVLNQIAEYQLAATKDIVPNWVISVPDPNVTIGHAAEGFRVEVIMRGLLAGSAWRTYESGMRVICDYEIPDGMKQNQAFDEPILTPTTKADEGHDEDITEAQIIEQGLVGESDWQQISDYAKALFKRGQELAKQRGLILVDTKYEFGKTSDGKIIVIDEIHTPDSSRYFHADSYEEKLANNEPQEQLSKEFVREWLIEQGWQGQTSHFPIMSDEFIATVSQRYIDLYEKLTGKQFIPAEYANVNKRIFNNVRANI